MLYACPACGFEVFGEPAGSYEICPVCDWEDDEVQLRFPDMRGGANEESLVEWQVRVVRRWPLDVTAHKGYRRCSDWRPLKQEEYSDTTGTPTSGREYFDAVGAEEPVYYWRKPRIGRSRQIAATVADAERAMTADFDRTKSLQELEQQDWGEPTFDSSLVTTCHRLRRKPINQFSVEDLRIMIGQQIGLPFLIPLALERLEADPMAEGDFYRGDLLCAVARVSDDFWTAHSGALERARKIVARVRQLSVAPDDEDLDDEDLQYVLEKLAGF